MNACKLIIKGFKMNQISQLAAAFSHVAYRSAVCFNLVPSLDCAGFNLCVDFSGGGGFEFVYTQKGVIKTYSAVESAMNDVKRIVGVDWSLYALNVQFR
jgi:hypothetical protein